MAYKPPGPDEKLPRGIFFKNGKYYANWSGPDGRMRNVAVGSRSAALARYQDEKAEVRRLRRYPDQADRNANPRLTLAALLERYRPTWEGQAQARMCKGYQAAWSAALGARFADAIRPGDLELWRQEQLRAEDPMGVATTNRYLSYLRHQYNLAIKDELADRNPVSQLGLLRENNARVRYLLDEEEAALREHLPRHHWRAVAFALHTGLRRGEQVGPRGHRGFPLARPAPHLLLAAGHGRGGAHRGQGAGGAPQHQDHRAVCPPGAWAPGARRPAPARRGGSGPVRGGDDGLVQGFWSSAGISSPGAEKSNLG